MMRRSVSQPPPRSAAPTGPAACPHAHLATRLAAAEAEEARQLWRAAWRYLAVVGATLAAILLAATALGVIP